MVWQMRDAVFQGYAGAAFTHSSGGGLLEPADFHGMAALLIKDRVKGSKTRPAEGVAAPYESSERQ